MAHTIMKQLYNEEKKKYVECEVLVLDEEEGLPNTDRREIILQCIEPAGQEYSEIINNNPADIDGIYEETELIDQYTDFDNRTIDQTSDIDTTRGHNTGQK